MIDRANKGHYNSLKIYLKKLKNKILKNIEKIIEKIFAVNHLLSPI
jgi:hypothetical protein